MTGALFPASASLEDLAREAAGCRACPLWARATQTVFGEGAVGARVVLVGEQPGDREDRSGRPFVGPAGRVLDEGLERAGIDRSQAYVTNAVKHFKWTAKGKVRLHQAPSTTEVAACRPWLLAELEAVAPEVLVLLGATAARSLLGDGFRVSRERGRWVPAPVPARTLATVHPSSVLRGDPARRQEAMDAFVADLAVVGAALGGGRGAGVREA